LACLCRFQQSRLSPLIVPQLLQRASQVGSTGIEPHAPLPGWNRQIPGHLQLIPPTQAALVDSSLARGQCSNADCAETINGTCLTASWERAFRTALLDNVNDIIATSPSSNGAVQRDALDSTPVAETSNGMALSDCSNQNASTGTDSRDAKALSSPATKAILPTFIGRSCQDCGRPSIVLYQSGDGQLVCKACRRRRPTR
jgi:hypothetical protein